METATVDRRDMQYSYKDGEGYVFMDLKTYEQTYVTAETVGEAADLMLEGQDVIVAFHENDVLFIELPAAVVLTVAHHRAGPAGRPLLGRDQARHARDRCRDSGSAVPQHR